MVSEIAASYAVEWLDATDRYVAGTPGDLLSDARLRLGCEIVAGAFGVVDDGSLRIHAQVLGRAGNTITDRIGRMRWFRSTDTNRVRWSLSKSARLRFVCHTPRGGSKNRSSTSLIGSSRISSSATGRSPLRASHTTIVDDHGIAMILSDGDLGVLGASGVDGIPEVGWKLREQSDATTVTIAVIGERGAVGENVAATRCV